MRDKNINNLRPYLMQNISFLRTNDIVYASVKIIQSALLFNAEFDDKRIDIYFFDVIGGLRYVKGVDKNGEIKTELIAIEKTGSNLNIGQTAKEPQRLINLPKAINVLRNEYRASKDSKTNSKEISYVIILPDFVDFSVPDMWLSIKDYVVQEAKPSISFMILGNSHAKIPGFMDRYIAYPNMSDLIPMYQDCLKERMGDIKRVLGEKMPTTFGLEERIHSMTTTEFSNLMRIFQTAKETNVLTDEYVDLASKQVWREIAQNNGLNLIIDNDTTLDSLGGLSRLKDDVRQIAHLFINREEAIKQNIPIPKSIILQGMQGAGKTEMAKAIANECKAKLIIFNIANMFGSKLGETESNMSNAIASFPEQAPVVILVDEVDKMFLGMESSGKSDSGTTARAIQTWLTYLQTDHGADGVFLVNTANDLSKISSTNPEFIRKGRHDQIYFIDIPNREARSEIIKIHLNKMKMDKKTVTTLSTDSDLLDATDEFTGAEIEEGIKESKRRAYYSNPKDAKITKEMLMAAFGEVIPISKIEARKIDEIRQWGLKYAVNANGTVAEPIKAKDHGLMIE